ncbi:MAG: tRNA (adenosine(37)-N6)-dimethylallyltransferase MiaA [Bacteroidales bacterium]|nr:tRNA (adenosine(37)-N6)-dimethylallyltransferase MiaA [Bacteroidales bacterium]
MSKSKKLIIVVGPTSVGKTEFGILIAEKLNTEIISADSRQFYKELKIGTAAPTEEELKRVKHHFVGHISITDSYNVSKFETDAMMCLTKIFEKNNYAVMVGGSGLYIDAVCKGIDDLPDADEELRARLKEQLKNEGIESIRLMLKKLDPEYYSKVDKANPNRLLRAIEVCLATGKTFSELRSKKPKERNFEIIKIGLNRNREELCEIINKRVDVMIQKGLVDEAKKYHECKNSNALNTVGYKEIFNNLEGKCSLEFAIEKIKTNTRRYAKRQLTWFRKDNDIRWFDAEKKEETFIDICRLLEI